jgi:hypothetical protein
MGWGKKWVAFILMPAKQAVKDIALAQFRVAPAISGWPARDD